ncbi:hypothetical protein KL864_10780 [Mycolicibacterium goodii]|uniref:hypothetical protein n=1 Tax=Mycolicibacterium goodii TaxID=134601 RepID=UPI001BDD546D|nr:hypothetical protein [Mycolicibacterium goodii]MBU8816390.1 hypothetical protein [Mycolicibacterium goodii]
MSARLVTAAGDRLVTDDGDGITREWDALTRRYIRTVPDPNTRAASTAGPSL